MLSYQHKKHPVGNFIYGLAYVVQTAALASRPLTAFLFQTIRKTASQRKVTISSYLTIPHIRGVSSGSSRIGK